MAGNQRGLAAQAMKELANLQYHTGNNRGAFHWWAEALDVLLNTRGNCSSTSSAYKVPRAMRLEFCPK